MGVQPLGMPLMPVGHEAVLALVKVPVEATPITQLKVLLLELIAEVARQVMLFRLLQPENISR